VPAGIPTANLVAAPNPACGPVKVQWQVKQPGRVTLRVFDNAGRAVHTIQDGYQTAGRYSASWSGVCDNGMRAANGVLFYTLDAPGTHRVVKVAIVSR
jgi:flagellar hook assembly protein FlgD